MAVFARDDSASTFQLPARPVTTSGGRSAKSVPRNHRRTSSREEQAARIGVGMQYTILRDPPWAAAAGSDGAVANNRKKNSRASAEESSVHSDDINPRHDVPQPPTLNKHDPYHAHPTQRPTDPGTQLKTSRLPIFQQVRHMLHKPPSLHTDTTGPRWDEYSGERDENGKPAQVTPSTYVDPYAGMLKPALPRDRPKKKRDMKRDVSPVSMLTESDLSLGADEDYTVSPISPISHTSSFDDRPPSPGLHYPRTRTAQYLAPPSLHQTPIRRKPVVATLTPIVSAAPSCDTSRSRTPSGGRTDLNQEEETEFARSSRFSWTTYTNSTMTERPSTAEMTPLEPQHGFGELHQDSQFSWTTINTSPYHAGQMFGAPPIPPRTRGSPPTTRIDSARGPPVQSILSRSRPVQRADMEEPIPSMRIKTSLEPGALSTLRSHPERQSIADPVQTGNGKKLPLPPELAGPDSHMTHLEHLKAQEQDLDRQRTNTYRAIAELEKLQKASPIDVPFAVVRDAKKRLDEYRLRLSEVERDLRDVGIAISRLRRKDGQENGLWVRRVTG